MAVTIGSVTEGNANAEEIKNNSPDSELYENNKKYLQGSLVKFNDKIYLAKRNVPSDVDLDNPYYWEIFMDAADSKRVDELFEKTGNLDELETESKDNLVAAINEVGSIQPDWNQNDETKKDYIKNRTHWVEEKTILEETTFTIENSADGFAFGNFPVTLSVGDMCNVVYDGEAYTCIVADLQDFVYIDGAGFEVDFQNQPDGLCAITIYSNPGEHTISILQRVYHPIPDEYIPDWVASVDNIIQSDWNQNDETAKDYIKSRPGGYYGEITEPTLIIYATKQDGINKLTNVEVIEDNFRSWDEDSMNVVIDSSSGIIHRMLTKRSIPGYIINEYGSTIYGNAHLVHESQPDTGEDLAIFKEVDGGSTYGIGWHVWATSLPSGNLSLSVIKIEERPIPFASEFIPWKASPTANSVLYTAQSLTEEEQAQARTNIGAGTPYTLPQATAEALGGVKADSAEVVDTQPVRIGGDGKLYTAAGTDISLGLTSASVDQMIKVKAVDDTGKPTEWEAVNDKLPNPTPSDIQNVLSVDQIGEFEYGYVFKPMPNINDFISLEITSASPGQFARVKYVDDTGKPTAWEAADAGELKFTKIYEHTVTAEEATTVIEYKITKEAVPNLGKYNIFVGEIEFAEKTAFSKWVKLKVNNADVAQICGGISTDKAVFFSASANRLFGRWCGINVYDTNKNNGTYMITLPCAYSLIANNAIDAESVSIHSYAPDFGLVEGAILRVYAAK